MLRTIRMCLAIAVAYNVVAAGLAVAGLLSPVVAAALMPASSICVLTLAIRARTVLPPGAAPDCDGRRTPVPHRPKHLGVPA